MIRLLLAGLLASALLGCGSRLSPVLATEAEPVFRLPQPQIRRINQVTVHTFENGLTLIHREETHTPIVGVCVAIRSGAASDPRDRAGLSNLLVEMLPKGTRNRTADEIAEELGQLGSALSVSARHDFSTIQLQCVDRDLAPTMELLADILFEPTFLVDELELEKKHLLSQIRRREDQIATQAGRRFRELLFGPHPYGVPVLGYPDTLVAITAEELAARHRERFRVSNMIVSVVGNAGFDEVRRLVERTFPEVQRPVEPEHLAGKTIATPGVRETVRRDSSQAYVILGTLTCPLGDPDEPAVRVADAILGSGMSSRLFQELRDKRGLAYSVGSMVSFQRDQGFFMVSIGTSPGNIRFNPQAPDDSLAEAGLWFEVERLKTTPVGEDELERAKNYIAGTYLHSHERNAQKANYLAYWHLTGRGVDYDRRYLDDIRAVTPRDVMRVANKYFIVPTTVVVGPDQPAPAGNAGQQ